MLVYFVYMYIYTHSTTISLSLSIYIYIYTHTYTYIHTHVHTHIQYIHNIGVLLWNMKPSSFSSQFSNGRGSDGLRVPLHDILYFAMI